MERNQANRFYRQRFERDIVRVPLRSAGPQV